MTTISRRELLAGATGTLFMPPLLAAGKSAGRLADDSVYQLRLALTDQSGASFALDAHRGTPMIVSMFYTSCPYVCPMLVETIQATERKLTPEERGRLRVLLVSFDPDTDTVEVLQKTAQARRVDSTRWALARTDAAGVRKLAALLGIQYRAIGKADFNHSTLLVALDAEGRIAGKTGQLAGTDAAFINTLRRALSLA